MNLLKLSIAALAIAGVSATADAKEVLAAMTTQADTVSYYLGKCIATDAAGYFSNKGKLTAEDKAGICDNFVRAGRMTPEEFEKANAEYEAQLAEYYRILNLQSALRNGYEIARGFEGMKEKTGNAVNADLFAAGFREGFMSDSLSVDKEKAYVDSYFAAIMEREKQKAEEKAVANLEAGKAYLAKEMQADPAIRTTESGLAYKVLQEGDGVKPDEASRVKVHYEGRLIDGTVFDSSIERGEPAEFAVSRVVPGFSEGLLLMSKGAKYRLYIPAELGYGKKGTPGGPIGPNEMLIFDVELLEILPE